MNAESIGAHTWALFIPATCAQFGAAAAGSFAQQTASAAHASPVGATGGVAVGAPPVADGAHCAAQLWCMQPPAAIPACEHPGAFSIGAHWLIGLPAQMHALKSGHDAPTDLTGSMQLVVMHVLHASDADDPILARHATMSVGAPLVVGGDVVPAGASSVDALAGGCAPEGVEGPGAGSDPHAMAELKKRAMTTEARLIMA